jgi:hypothetical protein
MTLEELQNSDAVKEWLRTLLQNRTFNDILDVVQMQAMPSSKSIQTPLVPGLNPDTALAHMIYFHAGWAECINFIRSIPGRAIPPMQEPDTAPWEDDPQVRAIDAEIEQARKKQPHTTPQP